MKKFKRLLATVLSVLLLLTTIPAGALTAFAASSGYQSGIITDGEITRAEWLHNLVVVFDMVVEEDAMPDNYFSDLEETHTYYEDIILAVEFGVVNIEAGGELRPDDYATRDFAVSTLNYCLGYQLGEDAVYTFTDDADCSDPASAQIAIDRGWVELIDGCFSPETYLTGNEAKNMTDDAQDVLEASIVDENYDNTYDFAEDVIVIPDGTDVTIDENGRVCISNCPETLLVGDKFAVYFNGIPSTYKVANVSIEDNLTVVETEDLDSDSTIVDIDAQGVIGTDSMEIIPAEGVTVSVEEDSDTATYGIKKVKNISSEVAIGFGGLKGKVSVKIKNPYIDYQVNSSKASVALYGETEVTYNISASIAEAAGMSRGFVLFTCNVMGVGSFDVAIQVDFSGSAGGTVKGYLVAGVECEKGGKIRAIKSFTQKEYYTSVEAETRVSLKASLGVTQMPVISASVYAEVGVKANFSKKHFGDGKAPTTCTHFAAFLFAEYGASASAKFGIWKTSESVKYTIFDENNSPVRIVNHYEDGNLVAKCTRGTSYANFFTKGSSRWSGCGWISANGAYGLNADGTPFRLYDYTLDENNQATITKYLGNAYSVYIPSEIDGYVVVIIGVNAFQSSSVRNVVIPETVTSIGNRAFSACTFLRSINLPNSLKSIGYDAFYNCDSLEKINIPKSLGIAIYDDYYTPAVIYYTPFRSCDNLKTIEFEEGITSIVPNLFWNCTGLEKVKIPDTVTSIGANAFRNCSNLKEVIIPNTVTNIGNNSFSGCTALSNVNLPYSLNSIGYDAFYNCDSLEKINIPKSLKTAIFDDYYTASGKIYYTPFRSCDNLKTVEFEEGITSIISILFWNCTGLEKVKIPDTVTTIGASSFRGCSNLKEVIIPNTVTLIDNGAFSDCIALSNVELPNSLKTIGYDAFYNCDSLEKINIPKSLERANNYDYHTGSGTIYYTPFRSCDNLKTVEFEEGITSIISILFWNCTGLEKVKIPDTVTTIGASSFRGCSNLKEVIIPNTVTNIGNNSFSGCTALSNVNLPYSLNSIGYDAFYGCKSLQSIEIPDSVTSIGTNTFDGCSSLESIKLPNTRQNIMQCMFRNCTSLKAIELPTTVTTIQSNAFYGCTSLESFTFENGQSNLQEIGSSAFYGCSALKEAVLPETVQTIGGNAFQNCTALEKVYIPQSTKTIGDYAFMGCELLSDLQIADYSITQIGYQVFKDCPSLVKVELPKGLKTIGGGAFMNDTSLTQVTIPESVTSIDSTAFSYPEKTTIYGKTGSYAETFANDGGFAFNNNSIPVEGIILKDGVENVTLDVGETYRAEFEVYPEDANDVITLTANNSNVTINGHDIYARSSGDTVITAATTGGLTYQFNIHIRSVKNIQVITNPTKTTYIMGEELDKTGMAVQVNYYDGSSKIVDDYTISGFDSSAEGTNTVTVKWISASGSTYSTNFVVTIVDPTPKLTGIYIDTLPNKLNYEPREKLDTTGLVVKGTYTDNSTKEITDYTVSGYNALKTGTQTITVTSGEFTATFDISVSVAKTLTSISVNQLPDKTTYFIGDALNTDGLILTLTYSDNSTETVTNGFTTSGFSSTSAGEREVLVTYNGLTTNFAVTVNTPTITLSSISNNMNIGSTATLTATTTPSGQTVTWTSSDTSVATVSDGIITAKAAGMATITAKFTYNGIVYSNTCTVTVKDNVLIGDVNGDGRTNNKDLGLLMQKLNGWDVEIDDAVADVNADGKVNNKDYGLLMQYVNGWDVVLG